MDSALFLRDVTVRYGEQSRAVLDGASIANDISVPLSLIPEFLTSADAAVRAALPSARAATNFPSGRF